MYSNGSIHPDTVLLTRQSLYAVSRRVLLASEMDISSPGSVSVSRISRSMSSGNVQRKGVIVGRSSSGELALHIVVVRASEQAEQHFSSKEGISY